MSKIDAGLKPKASSTAVKLPSQRPAVNNLTNTNNNDTFSSMFSDELTASALVKKTFSEMSNNKINVQRDSMYSSSSGQSSLGILELDNMSDIGNTHKRDSFSFNTLSNPSSNHSILQCRLSQATQVKNTLAKASSVKNIFDKNLENNKSIRTSLTNITNAFGDMLKEGMNYSSSSFTSEDFIPGCEFKENLAQIEEVNRKEFGSLSESRFNFSLGENQSFQDKSYAAKYFAAKSEDLSAIFPKKQNNNEMLTNNYKEKHCSLLGSSDKKTNQEFKEPIGYKTMSSITSWTDSHVSNNLLNLTMSDISEVLTSKTNSVSPKELAKALLSGDLSLDKQLLQRRFSTSTRFTSNASKNFEQAELSFSSLEDFRTEAPQKEYLSQANQPEKNKCVNIEVNDINDKNELCFNTSTQYTKINKSNLSTNVDKKYTKTLKNDGNYHFILTPKSGYFEDCTSETKLLENNIDLSNFSVLTNNHDVITEISPNKSTNVSKIVYCNEMLYHDKLNQSHFQDYKTMSEVLEIGDICIGTYSQAVITLENCLTVDAKYTLNLLNISLNYSKDAMYADNKPIVTNIATVLCSNKMHVIPALTETSFTIGIIPLVCGSISVYIKLESNDVSQDIYRNIQINSMEPQIAWVNNSFGSIDFGLLPELSQKSLPIKLLNKGTYQVPIKFILNQNQCEDIIQVKAIINPSELWQCDVNILTPNLSKNNSKTKLITSRLQIVLDSVAELSTNYSPLLYCSNLSGHVGLTRISFDQNPLILKKNGQSTLNGVLEISNNSELPICLFVQQNKNDSGFSIRPDKFQLVINEKIKLKIETILSKPFNFNEKSICFQVKSSQKQFFVKVNCIEPNSEFQQSNSPSSRPLSPWSSTSSSSAVGQLELESTCKSLIWGSIPSNTKSIQTFTLRNRGSHKEKLLLRIKDNKNCFKLISSGENHVSEMKLLLEPMESQKLSVILISTSNDGEAYGQLILQRQRSSEKNLIPLYGYCGHSDVAIHGTFEDNFGNMWLYPNPQCMTSQFSVTNSGNTTAFVKIYQENPSSDLIEPNEFILKRGESTMVEVTIVMCPERLEMLIEKESNSKVVHINKLFLIYGDEVSRVRVSRLWNKVKYEKKIVYPDQKHLDEVSSMFNGVNFVNVDHLIDNEKSLLKLWKTGISEDSIVILMERSNLESLLCDTTTVFSNLETTIIHRQ